MEEYFALVWIAFAVFMLICEALTSQLVSIWFVFGGIVAAISCIFTDNMLIQLSVFIVISFVCLLATRPLVKKITKKEFEKTNSDRLIGRLGIVTIDIVNNNGSGQVNVDGKIWSAKSADEREIKAGANIKVIEIQGVKLVVEVV